MRSLPMMTNLTGVGRSDHPPPWALIASEPSRESLLAKRIHLAWTLTHSYNLSSSNLDP